MLQRTGGPQRWLQGDVAPGRTQMNFFVPVNPTVTRVFGTRCCPLTRPPERQPVLSAPPILR